MAPVIWLTGLSGAGKSTVARSVEQHLLRQGQRVQVLDGDEIRATLSRGLGFTRGDREEHLRRLSFVAGLLARHDVTVIVAAITPYRNIRDEIRTHHAQFFEVYVNAPLSLCEQRDPKGLYCKARQGLIPSFTGISDEYEPPLAPDLECRTGTESIEQSAQAIIALLRTQGTPVTDTPYLVSPSPSTPTV